MGFFSKILTCPSSDVKSSSPIARSTRHECKDIHSGNKNEAKSDDANKIFNGTIIVKKF